MSIAEKEKKCKQIETVGILREQEKNADMNDRSENGYREAGKE